MGGVFLVNVAGALCAAALGALLAQRARLPPMLGYVIAGLVIGPFTPGFVGDAPTISAMADIGVILLMFAIGARLPLRDLRRVGRTAIIGALVQVVLVIACGSLVGQLLGFRPLESVFFGAVVSNSSSTVITKLLGDRGEVESEHGRIALAWSSVQDLTTVVLIVVLSSLSSRGSTDVVDVLVALARAAAFLTVLVLIGGRLFERLFHLRTVLASREVFVLALAASALMIAHLSTLFGLSLALGAFAAGMVVAETDVAHHAVAQITPVRDVFAGLFFVAVGMLVQPMFVMRHAVQVAIALALVILVKGLTSGVLARMLGNGVRVSILIGAALGQSAEFSFLLARLGANLGAVSETAFNVMLAACVLSVVFAPLTDRLARRVTRRLRARAVPGDIPSPPPAAIVCGYGRVGEAVCAALERASIDFVVIDERAENVRDLRARGVDAQLGDASQPLILERAGVSSARLIVIAVPDALDTRAILDHAAHAAPDARIVVRTHSRVEHSTLAGRGAWRSFIGEIELARAMARASLLALDVSSDRADAIATELSD